MKWILLAVFLFILLFIPDISNALEIFFTHPFRYFLAITLGAIFYGWLTFKKEGQELPSFLKLLFFGTNALFFITWGVAFFFGKSEILDVLAHVGFLVIGMLLVALLERSYIPFTEKLLSSFTKKAGTERDHLTDVREVAREAEKMQSAPSFDPEDFFQGAKEDEIFIGLSEDGKPIYVDATQHMEFVGTTGSGKGRMGGVVCTQFAKKGNLVLYMDPKDDEFSPHVLYKAATDAGVTFNNVDLSSKKRQLNIFAGCTPDQFEELLLAGFELLDKGGDSDFYKIGDRKVCYALAQVFKDGDTAEKLYKEHKKLMEKAEAFEGKFFELANMKSINALDGISLEEAFETGGVINFIGSMRNPKVVRIQKMLLVRFIQLAESRDRIKGKPRQIRVVLDELKYHLSRTALEALGAARDKGLSIVMMHQSLGDLRDCPSDLKPESVVDAVFENASLKVVYRLQSPETAEFFARKSGKILVDVETRQVDKTLGLAQKVRERRITQEQSYLYDENEILYLPKGVGIVFGHGLPQKVSIAPIQVTKSYEAITVQEFGGSVESKSVDLDCEDELILGEG